MSTESPQQMSELQVRVLADRAYRWIKTIKRLNDKYQMETILGLPRDSEPYDDIHFLCLAIDHLTTCLGHLHRAGHFLGGEDITLCREWEKLADLRDALEHEEDYVAGVGKKPRLVGGEWSPWGEIPVDSYTVDDFGISSVNVLGRDYEIGPIIGAVLHLPHPLVVIGDIIIDELFSLAEAEGLEVAAYLRKHPEWQDRYPPLQRPGPSI